MNESRELIIASDPQVSLQRKDVATGLFKSGLFPNAKNEYGAYAIVQYGAELGLAPMVSLQNINVISGKLACNGQVMLSLAISRGVVFQVLEESAEKCSIKFSRGPIQYISHFTMNDAKEAGLTGKDNWNKWKRDMLFWRAVAKGVRRIAPEAVMGLYTADELTDGEVIDVSANERPTQTVTATVTPHVSDEDALRNYPGYQDDSGYGKEDIRWWRAQLEGLPTKASALNWAKENASEIKKHSWNKEFKEEFAAHIAQME